MWIYLGFRSLRLYNALTSQQVKWYYREITEGTGVSGEWWVQSEAEPSTNRLKRFPGRLTLFSSRQLVYNQALWMFGIHKQRWSHSQTCSSDTVNKVKYTLSPTIPCFRGLYTPARLHSGGALGVGVHVAVRSRCDMHTWICKSIILILQTRRRHICGNRCLQHSKCIHVQVLHRVALSW